MEAEDLIVQFAYPRGWTLRTNGRAEREAASELTGILARLSFKQRWQGI